MDIICKNIYVLGKMDKSVHAEIPYMLYLSWFDVCIMQILLQVSQKPQPNRQVHLAIIP